MDPQRLRRAISSPELRRGDPSEEKPSRLRRTGSSPDLHRGPRLANEGALPLDNPYYDLWRAIWSGGGRGTGQVMDARRASRWIGRAPDDALDKVWLRVPLVGPTELAMTGIDVRSRLLGQAPLDLETARALVRLLRELERETAARRPRARGRHYVAPEWGIDIANGGSSLERSYELFMSPPPPFLIDRRTIVLALACCGGVWSCYALDLGACTVSVMDPSGRRPLPYARALGHADVARRMVEHAVRCARRASGDRQLGRGIWKPKLVTGQGRSTSIVGSGFQAVSCMRWYTGSGRGAALPSPGHPPEQARRDLVLQLLLSMAATARDSRRC